MTWFEQLTGFKEASPRQVRGNLRLKGEALTSLVNGKTYIQGRLETPSLLELRNRVTALGQATGRLSLREVIADVTELHVDPANAGCLFQVASQFNLLEMTSPRITPEQGVGIYEDDPTQGPACAIAAGAGTIYRNYFACVKDHIGQSAHHQIDCLADIGMALDNASHHFWKMKNGYVLASRSGLGKLSSRLAVLSEHELDQLRRFLRIGLQWNTQVTLEDC
jgi:hypothetical protein